MSNEFYTLFSYGVAITVQIFMYCWFGNEVEIKVKNVLLPLAPTHDFVFRVIKSPTPHSSVNGRTFPKT